MSLGSMARTRMPKAQARRAICVPTPPRPTITMVLPCSSVRLAGVRQRARRRPDAARQRQQQGERLIGHVGTVDALGVGQHDRALDQLVGQCLFHARVPNWIQRSFLPALTMSAVQKPSTASASPTTLAASAAAARRDELHLRSDPFQLLEPGRHQAGRHDDAFRLAPAGRILGRRRPLVDAELLGQVPRGHCRRSARRRRA